MKGVKVATRLREGQNRTVTVWFRIPKSNDAASRESNRVLVLFGGRNTDGVEDAKGRLGWGEWADKEGVFIVCPGFKDVNYWEPEVWSGKALTDALEEIRKRYPVCTAKLLFYGYSAGSQCANLFPAWQPKQARAWVSHACGVFHEPSVKIAGVQWMQVESATKTLPPFVGDDQDGVFYPSDDRRVKRIPAEDRVELPSEEVALAWGAARTP